MKMKLLCLIFLSLGTFSLIGQVNIVEEAKISRLMENYVRENRSTNFVQAWKIQLITTNDRRKMDSTRSKFAELYPEIPIKWKHVSPYYQVQIGAYRRKLDLQYFLMSLKEDFPNAIPVTEKIHKKELLY